ncbi:MAG: lytic transglycosylase domain-containing protein [Bacteroidales bacterium]|jgi:hypothetical protein|nr:lytic transglycosylase domain-containing protein [Bacteroidales bacterium]
MKPTFLPVALLLLTMTTCGFCVFAPSFGNDGADTDSLSVHFASPPFPAAADFSGESLPLERFDVREALERELIVNANFHSNTLQYLKRAYRYFPVIEPILAENNIPGDFKFLALIESDFLYKVSPKGAAGFWQFIKDSAIECGLEVNSEVDERYHLEKATVAACKSLNNACKMFGSWTMSAAAYNMGTAGLSKQANRQQCDNYYDLLLSDETMRYVFRIVAVKLIMNEPEKYGFSVPENEKYNPVPYTEVEVKTSVDDWAKFAIEHHTTYKMLKLLNPWLRDAKLTNAAKKTYVIKLPEE